MSIWATVRYRRSSCDVNDSVDLIRCSRRRPGVSAYGAPIFGSNPDFTRFRYTTALLNAFSGGGISGLQSFDNLGMVKLFPCGVITLLKLRIGWVNGSRANVFVTNHDTERVRNGLNHLPYRRSSNSVRLEWELAQRQLPVQHLRVCDDFLARTPLWHALHPLELQRLHQHRRRRAKRGRRHLFWERGRERVALPTPMDGRCGHGRVQEQCRRCGTDELGVAPVAADRVRTGSVTIPREYPKGCGGS